MIVSFLRGLRRVEQAVAVAMFTALVAVVFAGAVGRYSGYPVIWSDEAAQGLFVWVSLLAADMTLQRNGHFSIDMLANLLPPRARFMLDMAIYAVVGALLLVLVWNAFVFASMTASRPLPMSMISSAVATGALPVGFTLMLISLVELAIRRARLGPVREINQAPTEVM